MNAKELLDKYIKYNSKITFDIFKLLYQKLIDLNFTTPHKVEYAFEEFSGKYQYFVMDVYDGELFFNQHSAVISSRSEISVEDLLGYNPFKSFILPEKWYIKVMDNSNNYPELEKWRGSWCHQGVSYVKSDLFWTANLPKDFTEITLEQFKQYVLKEPVMIKSSKPFPSRWCIKLDKTTIPIVGNYYNKKDLEDPNCVAYTQGAIEGKYVRSHNNAGEYVKNGYTYCSFFNKPNDEYPEITLEDFKQFVMEETTNNTEKDWSKATEKELLEKVVPEYVECYSSRTDTFIINKIYKCEPRSKVDVLTLNSEKGSIISNLPYEGSLWEFKPSTKEAFEAQNKPKSIEKWSVGSYVVPLQDRLLTRDEPLIKGKPYQITKRSSIPYIMCEKGMEINFRDDDDPEIKEGIKWFATLAEAEEFSRILVGSVKEGVEQPLKQAVHCKTQEEWDFVLSKLPSTSLLSKQSEKFEEYIEENPSGIAVNTVNCEWSDLEWWEEEGYQILSFQEWCNLNEYKYDGDILQTPEICTYGLNVGDELDDTIINAWDKKGLNYWEGSSDGWIFGNSVPYYGDRKIENFKVIDGVVGFLVSGTHNIYLRAEGFKEFAENYNKSKEPEVKFEIDKWYKVCDGNVELYKGIWYVKSPKIVDGIVKVDQYLYNNCFGEGGNFGHVGDYTFVEVPLSEIQHLLLKCPSDKIEKATQNVVKVNTCKVRITSSEIKVLKF